MTNFLEIARRDLLDPAGLTDNQLQKVLSGVLGASVDNADLYFQSVHSETWALEEGIIKGGSFNIDRGVGVRAMSGEKTGFAYSDDILMPALEQAAHAARTISKSSGQQEIKAWTKTAGHELYLPMNPLETLTETEKVALLQRVDACARAQDARVIQVSVSLAAEYETVLIMASDGHLAADVRPLVRLNVSVVVEQNGRRENGYAGGGGRYSYKQFL